MKMKEKEMDNLIKDLENHPDNTLSLDGYISRSKINIPKSIKNYDIIIKELNNFKVLYSHVSSRRNLIGILKSIEWEYEEDFKLKYIKLTKIFNWVSIISLTIISFLICLLINSNYVIIIIIPIIIGIFFKIFVNKIFKLIINDR